MPAIISEDIVIVFMIYMYIGVYLFMGGYFDPPDTRGNLPHTYFILAPEIKRSN